MLLYCVVIGLEVFLLFLEVSDICLVSFSWDIFYYGLGYSLGSDILRGDRVKFNNANSIYIFFETL